MSESTTVMVVDDDEINLEAVYEALTSSGYKTICSSHPAKALEIALKQQPDFIVLDVVMPERSGIDVCKDLRTHPMTKDIPIILLTSSTEREHIVASLHLGCIDFLQKPLATAELVDTIYRHDMIIKMQEATKPAIRALEKFIKNYS